MLARLTHLTQYMNSNEGLWEAALNGLRDQELEKLDNEITKAIEKLAKYPSYARREHIFKWCENQAATRLAQCYKIDASMATLMALAEFTPPAEVVEEAKKAGIAMEGKLNNLRDQLLRLRNAVRTIQTNRL
jgi:hypothetical protein